MYVARAFFFAETYHISLHLQFSSTVDAPVSGHSRDAEIVSVTGADRLPELVNTKFVWELKEKRFCQGGRK